MGGSGKPRRSRLLSRAFGTVAGAALAAGLLTVGQPAGMALASPAAARPAAASSTTYVLATQITRIKALGHTWNLSLDATKSFVNVSFEPAAKGNSEYHEWETTLSFAPMAARDLTVTRTEHAALKTGTALSPVLAVGVAFTPTRHLAEKCTKGSYTIYRGYLTGTLSFATGLRGVKVSHKFTGKPVSASLVVDKSCVLPVKPHPTPCTGGIWSILNSVLTGSVGSAEILGAKSAWEQSFDLNPVKTASKWITRSDYVFVPRGGRAPKLNKTAHTITVSLGASGPITGAAVITYSSTVAERPVPSCYVGSKHYSERSVLYSGTSVRVTRPLRARTLLMGTLTMRPGRSADYIAISLKAK